MGECAALFFIYYYYLLMFNTWPPIWQSVCATHTPDHTGGMSAAGCRSVYSCLHGSWWSGSFWPEGRERKIYWRRNTHSAHAARFKEQILICCFYILISLYLHSIIVQKHIFIYFSFWNWIFITIYFLFGSWIVKMHVAPMGSIYVWTVRCRFK